MISEIFHDGAKAHENIFAPLAEINEIAAVIGNGDFQRGMAVLRDIAARLIHAREKHPVFAKNPDGALDVIESEFQELVYAAECESRRRRMDELLDCIATEIRDYNGEYQPDAPLEARLEAKCGKSQGGQG